MKKSIPHRTIYQKHLSENVADWIGNFLGDAGFQTNIELKLGVIGLVEMLRNYSEEGTKLNPEIIITTLLKDILYTIPNFRSICFSPMPFESSSFKKILKRCAPLSKSGWVIFIEPSGEQLKYGLISLKQNELSEPVYLVLNSLTSSTKKLPPYAFLRNVGGNTLDLMSHKTNLIINLSLFEKYTRANTAIEKLANSLSLDSRPELLICLKMNLNILIDDIIKNCHGCIIAVVKDDNVSISKFQKTFPDGAYLSNFLDIGKHIDLQHINNDHAAHSALSSLKTVLEGMLNKDGITAFSTNGRLIGFNVFIHETKKAHLEGGARQRAFEALKDSKACKACFIKSQDGKIEFWGGA